MIKYSSYTNHLRFSLRSQRKKIPLKDLQLKSRIKTPNKIKQFIARWQTVVTRADTYQ